MNKEQKIKQVMQLLMELELPFKEIASIVDRINYCNAMPKAEQWNDAEGYKPIPNRLFD